MYSLLQRLIKYSKYWLTGANSKGHGIHSPFVFQFVIDVLNDERFFYAFENIEANVNADVNNEKYNRVLFRIINYYQPKNLLVIDEIIGITTSYMALANTNARAYCYFSEVKKSLKAREVISKCMAYNCNFIKDLTDANQFDLVYIDAQNTAQLTETLERILSLLHQQSILIINNIHSTEEIETIWHNLQTNTAVTLTIDLFELGLVFFRPENKVAQHFTIRF